MDVVVRRRPERRLAWAAGLVGLVLTLAAGMAGRAAAGAVTQEHDYAAAISALGTVTSLAGRAEAVTATLADPRSNPAHWDEMRAELRSAAGVMSDFAAVLDDPDRGAGGPGLTAGPARLMADAQRARRVALAQTVRLFAHDARAAAVPGAALQPGQLIRGDMDSEYLALARQAGMVRDQMAVDAAASAARWSRLVTVAVATLAAGVLASVGLLLGPVGALIARFRARELAAEQARLDATTYVEQLVETVDIPLVAADADGEHLTINAAGRALFDWGTTGRFPAAQLAGAWQLWAPGAETAVPPEQLPRARAARGEHVTAQEYRLVRAAQPPAVGPGERRVVVTASPLTAPDGRKLGTVTTLQDVTALHAQNQALARHADQLAAISQATAAVLRESDPRATVCRAAAAVSGATTVVLFEYDGHTDLVCTASFGPDTFGMRMPLDGHSVLARVFASPRSRTLTQLGQHPDVDTAAMERLSRLSGHEFTSAAWIPVLTAGRCQGVLALGFADDADPAAHVPLLEILAAETAVAIERQDLLRRLALEADTDALTGAANRRAWQTLLPAALDRARSTGAPVSVLMLDLDHFKAYNDQHGHPAGDALLRQTAHAWKAWLRPEDTLARYGGEEFAVILPGCSAPDARRVAEALRALVPHGQTCSAGIATWDRQEAPDLLLGRADTALYESKRAGRNRCATSAAG